MPSLKHTHTYVRYKKRPGYWRCSNPRCYHIIDQESVLGKATCCTTCGAEFVLTREDLRRANPRCLNCADTQKARFFRASRAALESRLPKMDLDFPVPPDDGIIK